MTHPVTTPNGSLDAAYRVTFDVMAGVEPMTFPAGTSLAEVTDRLRRKFLAADVIDEGHKFDAAIDFEVGDVTISADGDVIEHGSITWEESIPVELDLRQELAAKLHRIAGDLIRLDLPVGGFASLRFGVVDSRADLDPWADYLGAAVDTPDGIPFVEKEIPLDGARSWLTVGVQSPKESVSELEAARARVAELEAQLAAGATR